MPQLIVIGKHGAVIQLIIRGAEKHLSEVFLRPVHLRITVEVANRNELRRHGQA